MYPRFVEPRIRDALADTRAVLLSGPRQSGKTTLGGKLADGGVAYMTPDNATVLGAADPVGFVRGLNRAVIDEVQRAPSPQPRVAAHGRACVPWPDSLRSHHGTRAALPTPARLRWLGGLAWELWMGVVQVGLPEELSNMIDRHIEAGRVENADAYLAEAIRRYAEDLEAEDEIIAEAEAGIRDAEAGRCATISGPEDVAALEQRIIGRLRARLASDGR